MVDRDSNPANPGKRTSTPGAGSPSGPDSGVPVSGEPAGDSSDAIPGSKRQPLLEPGDRLGGCLVTKFLAWGGMGEVYEGLHEVLDRRVAIKLIRERHADDPKYRSRFLREAKAAAKLTDPHLGLIFDAGTTGDQIYAVLEFIEGEDVSRRLRNLGTFSASEALPIVRDVAKGLAAAHAAGVIHRDVKPSNIMLTAGGKAKLMDFGLARVNDAQAGDQTETGTVVGTPQYMSPEQWTGQNVDARTDLYSLGVSLYEMLSGRWPVSGSTIGQICMQACNQQLVPLRERHPGLDPKIYALVDWLLAPLDERCPSARELIAKIDRILSDRTDSRGETSLLDELALSDSRVSAPTAALPVAKSGSRSPKLWIALGGIGLGLMLVALALLLYSSDTPPPESTAASTVNKVPDEIEGTATEEVTPVRVQWIARGLLNDGKGAAKEVNLLEYSEVKSKDQLKFNLIPDQDCYLYVIWVQSQGEALLLFPDRLDGEAARVKAHDEVVLPAGRNQWYELDHQAGKEVIYLAASREPLNNVVKILEAATIATRGGPGPVNRASLENALRSYSLAEAEESDDAPTSGETVGTRGLMGVTQGRPIRIEMPDGSSDERKAEELVGKSGLLRKLVLEHR